MELVAYAADVAQIFSTEGLPEVAIAPMENVVATMRGVATACKTDTGPQAQGRSSWRLPLSNMPGINLKG